MKICFKCANKQESGNICERCGSPNVLTEADYEKLMSEMERKKEENHPENIRSERELKSAMDYPCLQENLFKIITEEEFPKVVVGEEVNCSAIFLTAITAFIDGISFRNNLLVNSQSSAGKDYICRAVLSIFPEEMREYASKVTPELLAYWHNAKKEPEWTWNGKTLYLPDVRESILKSDALKVFVTEDNRSVVLIKQKVVDIEINGKPSVILTTANSEPNSEILNRFNIITLDESEKQTENILRRESLKRKGETAESYSKDVVNALRFLEPYSVVIPFADKIDKHFPYKTVRTRRDYSRFLNLISASAVLHQYSREKDSSLRIVAEKSDYENARYVMSTIKTGIFFDMPYNLRKAFTLVEKYNNGSLNNRFTAQEIWKKFPTISRPQWYRYLDALARLGAVDVDLEKREDSKKQITTYGSVSSLQAELKLPNYDELIA